MLAVRAVLAEAARVSAAAQRATARVRAREDAADMIAMKVGTTAQNFASSYSDRIDWGYGYVAADDTMLTSTNAR